MWELVSQIDKVSPHPVPPNVASICNEPAGRVHHPSASDVCPEDVCECTLSSASVCVCVCPLRTTTISVVSFIKTREQFYE